MSKREMQTTQTGNTAAPDEPAGNGRFEPVHLATLQIQRCYDFDLYLPGESGATLYRGQQTPFSAEDRARLMENGVTFLQIAVSDGAAYRKYLVGQLADLVGRPDIALPRRCTMVNESARNIAEELVRNPDQEDLYDEADALIRSLVDLVLKEPKALEQTIAMLRHDYQTHTHLVNVATLSVVLALQMGIRDPKRLYHIGLGGLLHDIGKTRIDPEVLTSPSALTAKQLAELRRHPEYGMIVLVDVAAVPGDVIRIVLEHHERLDGEGYPAGLGGGEISIDSQICAVADIFDGMTSRRPYRDALDVRFTLDHLAGQRGDRLHSNVVDAWLEMAEAWSVNGSDVVADAQAIAAGMVSVAEEETDGGTP